MVCSVGTDTATILHMLKHHNTTITINTINTRLPTLNVQK